MLTEVEWFMLAASWPMRSMTLVDARKRKAARYRNVWLDWAVRSESPGDKLAELFSLQVSTHTCPAFCVAQHLAFPTLISSPLHCCRNILQLFIFRQRTSDPCNTRPSTACISFGRTSNQLRSLKHVDLPDCDTNPCMVCLIDRDAAPEGFTSIAPAE
jgi:hypothetical protein